MPEPDPPATDPQAELGGVACPACGQVVDVPTDPDGTTHCPHCGEVFLVIHPDDEATVDADEDADREAALRRRADELDGVHVRQVMALRRGLFRQQSYCLIAAGGLLVAAGQLGWMTVQWVRTLGWAPRPIGYLCIAVVCVAAAVALLRMASRFRRELDASTVPAPTTPPDLSTLSNGSQLAENLNRIR